jgi:hypothetical protein
MIHQRKAQGFERDLTSTISQEGEWNQTLLMSFNKASRRLQVF